MSTTPSVGCGAITPQSPPRRAITNPHAIGPAMTHQFGFDLFNIGAGSGGVTGSRRAAAHGARVGNCDDDRVDRTCVIRACMWHCCDRVSEST